MEQAATIDMPVYGECSAEELRAASDRRGEIMPPAIEPVSKVIRRKIQGPGGEIPLRIYIPANAEPPYPVIMVFHGGGWTIRSYELEGPTSRGLANRVGAIAISVQYRLAPETRFPGAADDCYAATEWAIENAAEFGGDASQLAVAGTSAGGNLSAAVSQMARDRNGPKISHQVLFCPVIDHNFTRSSYDEFADGYGLTKIGMQWFWDNYLGPDGDGTNPYASPLQAESLSGLPDATVIVAECDVLRDEAEEYAAALKTAGVDTRLTRYEGVLHGFNCQPGHIHAAESALDEAADRIKKSFANTG
jgi:acetyl esterase